MYNENNPFENKNDDFELNDAAQNVQPENPGEYTEEQEMVSPNVTWQSDSGFQMPQSTPASYADAGNEQQIDFDAQEKAASDFSFSVPTNSYYPNVNSPKKKSKTGKIVLSLAICAALFMGTAVGISVPRILNDMGDDNNGRPTVNIMQNKSGSDGATKTASKSGNISEGKEKTTQEIAATVGPAVVGIENMGKAGFYGVYGSEVTMGSGSGVVMTQDGYIVTNYHVVEGSSKLKVTMSTGDEYDAKVVGADEDSDLAVIKIDAKDLVAVTFGDSAAVTVGDKAIAIGNPLGKELMGTVTQGIISAVNRTVQIDNKTMTLLQTDAAINSGNSGGALINAYGEVIGINSAKMAASGVEGLGFSIPSNTVLDVVHDLIDYGYVRGKLTIGIGGTNITEKMAMYYDLPMGFYVQEVYEGTGAAQAGIKPGDIIIKCDGKVVQNIDDINELKKKHKVGETMVMEIVRNEQKVTVKVVLQEEKPEMAW